MKLLALLSTLLVAALLAGCGGSDEAADDVKAASPSSPIGAGPGISIDEALASGSAEPLLVNGNLLANGDEVLFCSALGESFPPSCSGASLRVEGLKLEEVDSLTTAGEVSWTDMPIQLLGVVEGDVLRLSANVQA